MSSQASTSESLGKAGITVLILRILAICINPIPNLYLTLSSSPNFLVYYILLNSIQLIAFVTSLVFMIFVLIALIRMKSQSKLGLVFGIIIISLEILNFVAYFILFILFDALSLISLSPVLVDILLYFLIGIPILLGISYMIFFIVLAKNLAKHTNLGNTRLIINFTIVFGIFQGLYYIFTGITYLTFILSGSPPMWVLYLLVISTSLVIFFGSIAGISLIIVVTGYILYSKRT